MHNTPQWIVTKRTLQADGKIDKLPCDWRSGQVGINAHDPQFWTTHGMVQACAAAFGPTYGIGFVFTERDPFFFIDLDGVRTPEGIVTPYAQGVLDAFSGAYTEVSVSGRGMHIIGRYDGPEPPHRAQPKGFPGGIYTSKRFADITGIDARGDGEAVRTVSLRNLLAQFAQPEPPPGTPTAWTEGPCAEWRGPADDNELLRRALQSRSTAGAFTGKASFADLWDGNVDALTATYPPEANGEGPYNASAADMALAVHLMFWTGRDCERVERLMRQSALARDKWDEHGTYLRELTIMNALRMSRDVLQDRAPEPPPMDPGASRGPVGSGSSPDIHEIAALREPSGEGANNYRDGITVITGQTFLGPEQQKAHFAGCVYVLDQHRVLVPNGHLLRPEQFKAAYGGFVYAMDNANQRTSRNAWEAFTESQVLRAPRADSTCFRPNLPPAAMIEEGGRVLVNTYWPITTPRKAGDAGPFLDHLRRVLPSERDREILLAYMCAVVQHKGVKFQWAPLLQGVDGNGKSLFTECVGEAVGWRYAHMPRANEISEKFNSWLFDKLLIGVEDIYVPEQKRELVEILKPMITAKRQEMRRMNTDQITAGVCCNFIFNSNHRDAVQKTQNDRRFAIFFTAQQERADIARSGMDGDYFPKLYAWLNGGGFAIVSELLHTRPIPAEFNPAGSCIRAPDTSSTAAAIASGLGRAEQEIIEAAEQGRPGFCGGWVSSVMLSTLFKDLGLRIPLNKRAAMLDALGYEHHPGLPEGRVANPVAVPDGGAKPRLFVKRGHPTAHLKGIEAVREYIEAQQPAPQPAELGKPRLVKLM